MGRQPLQQKMEAVLRAVALQPKEAVPTQVALAKRVGMGNKQVNAVLRELQTLGLVVAQKAGNRRALKYWIDGRQVQAWNRHFWTTLLSSLKDDKANSVLLISQNEISKTYGTTVQLDHLRELKFQKFLDSLGGERNTVIQKCQSLSSRLNTRKNLEVQVEGLWYTVPQFLDRFIYQTKDIETGKRIYYGDAKTTLIPHYSPITERVVLNTSLEYYPTIYPEEAVHVEYILDAVKGTRLKYLSGFDACRLIREFPPALVTTKVFYVLRQRSTVRIAKPYAYLRKILVDVTTPALEPNREQYWQQYYAKSLGQELWYPRLSDVYFYLEKKEPAFGSVQSFYSTIGRVLAGYEAIDSPPRRSGQGQRVWEDFHLAWEPVNVGLIPPVQPLLEGVGA